MNKVIFGMSLLSALFSTTAFSESISENDFPGLRVGVGYSNTSIDLVSDDTSGSASGKGFKVEVGYDINRVIGFDASYEMVNDSLGNISNDAEVDGSTIKVGAEIGYAFYSKQAFLKPYINVGAVSFSDEDYDEQTVYGGVGLRFEYHNFYTDISVDGYYLDTDDGDDYYKFIQSAFTVGYKF